MGCEQDIHTKFMSLGFDDCKVFVNSVDAQPSAAGGIIVQVLGEMSNANGPWKRFAQTFFLAEQPNGYFVLNDVFRYGTLGPRLSARATVPTLTPSPWSAGT